MSERIELVMAQAVIQRIKAERDALTEQVAGLQAVITKYTGHIGSYLHEYGTTVEIEEFKRDLSQSSTDALESVKHEAWDEGARASYMHNWSKIPNPYRATPTASEPGADRG